MKNNLPLIPLEEEEYIRKGIKVFVLRLDQVNQFISGNKWYKLKYNLKKAVEGGFDSVLSFGGAFSNHIHALSYAAKGLGLRSIGIIRGEQTEELNDTLKDAKSNGMELHFISRDEYRKKNEPEFIKKLKKKFSNCYIVPEGGTNALAVKGTEEIVSHITEKVNYVACAVGTGGTLAGLIKGRLNTHTVIGFPVLKGGEFLYEVIANLTGGEYRDFWRLETNYHFGGYAKIDDNLIQFIRNFYNKHTIELEPVYTGKVMYGIDDMIRKNRFVSGDKIVVIHSGGLQGIRGIEKRFNLKLFEKV